jgi:hypothetical protein
MSATPLESLLAESKPKAPDAAGPWAPEGYEPIRPIDAPGMDQQTREAIEAKPEAQQADLVAGATGDLATAMRLVSAANTPDLETAKRYAKTIMLPADFIAGVLPYAKDELDAYRKAITIERTVGLDSYLAKLARKRVVTDDDVAMLGRLEAAVLERDGTPAGRAWFDLKAGARTGAGLALAMGAGAVRVVQGEKAIARRGISKALGVASDVHKAAAWMVGADGPEAKALSGAMETIGSVARRAERQGDAALDYAAKALRGQAESMATPELDTGHPMADFARSALFRGVPLLAASVAAASRVGPVPVAIAWGGAAGGEILDDLVTAGVPYEQAQGFAAAGGLAVASLERIQLGRWARTTKGELTRTVARWLGESALEAGVEAGQGFGQRAATEAGMVYGGKKGAVEALEAIVAGLADDAREGGAAAILTSILGLGGLTRGARRQLDHRRKAKAMREAEAAVAGGKASADTVREYAKKVVGDAGAVVKSVYIDARQVLEKYGQDEAKAIMQQMGAGDQFEAAVAAGVDVEIDAGEWLGTHAAAPDRLAPIRDFIRFSPDGPTIEQDRLHREEAGEIAKDAKQFAGKIAEMDASGKLPPSVKKFRDDTLARGYDAESADMLAAILMAGNKRAAAMDPANADRYLNRVVRVLDERMEFHREANGDPAPVAPAAGAAVEPTAVAAQEVRRLPAMTGFRWTDESRTGEILAAARAPGNEAYKARVQAVLAKRIADIKAMAALPMKGKAEARRQANQILDTTEAGIPFKIRMAVKSVNPEKLTGEVERALAEAAELAILELGDADRTADLQDTDLVARMVDQAVGLGQNRKQVEAARRDAVEAIVLEIREQREGSQDEIDRIEALLDQMEAGNDATSPEARVEAIYNPPRPPVEAAAIPVGAEDLLFQDKVTIDPLTDPAAAKPWADEWLEVEGGGQVRAGDAVAVADEKALEEIRQELARRRYDVGKREEAQDGPVEAEAVEKYDQPVLVERKYRGTRSERREQARIDAKAVVAGGPYYNANLKAEISVSRNSIDKALSSSARDKSATDDHYEIVRAIPELLRIATVGRRHADKNNDANIKEIIRLSGRAAISGDVRPVVLTVKVKRHPRGASFYSYELMEIETPGAQRAAHADESAGSSVRPPSVNGTISPEDAPVKPESYEQSGSARDRAAAALAKAEADKAAAQERVRARLAAGKAKVTPELIDAAMAAYVVALQRRAAGLEAFGQPDGGGDGLVDSATGLPLNDNGTVTLYHHTNAEAAAAIRAGGVLKSAGEPDVYLTTRDTPDTGYGEASVAVRVDPAALTLDDEFPDGRKDFRLSVVKPGGSVKVDILRQTVNDLLREDGIDPEAAPEATRGSIEFHPDGSAVIRAVRGKADLSTVLHELGHLFLKDLQTAVREGRGGERAAADLKILTEFGGGDDRAAVEKITRAWEAWLREGKAPSAKLGGAFGRFRAWLTGVYRDIRAYVGADLNDEVRGVFERMLASEAEIDEARRYYEIRGKLEDVIEADEARLAKVRKARAEAEDETGNEAARINVGPYLKALGGRKAFREVAEAQVDASPEFRALEAIREAGGFRREDVAAIAGEQAAEAISEEHGEGLLNGEADPVALLAIAAEHGFNGPEALLAALAATPDRSMAVKRAQDQIIAAEVEKFRAWARADDDLAGSAAYHNEKRLDLLAVEHDLLRSKVTKAEGRRLRALNAKAIRDEARAQVAKVAVRDLSRLGRWSAAERKAGVEAVELAREGRMEEAAEAKGRQAFAHAMVLEMFRAREAMEGIRRKYTSVRRMKAALGEGSSVRVEHAYREAIKDILTTFGLTSSRELRPLKAGPTVAIPSADYSDADARELGEFLPDLQTTMPDWLIRKETPEPRVTETRPEGFIDWRGLTVSQVEEMRDAIEALLKVGRGALTALRAEGMETLEQLKAESIARLAAVPDDKAAVKEEMRERSGRMSRMLKEMLLSNVVMDRVLDVADGNPTITGKEAGPLLMMFRKVRQANVAMETKLGQIGAKIAPALEVLAGFRERMRLQYGNGGDILEIPNLPVPELFADVGKPKWSPDQLIMAWMNTGNDANLYALQEGYSLSDLDVENIRRLFTKEESDAMQTLLDVVNEQYEEIDAVTFRLTNKHVPKEAALDFTVQTADGQTVQYSGGYLPLRYDRRFSDQIAGKMELAELADMARLGAVHGSARPANGMTKARLRDDDGKPAVKYPPQLSLSVLLDHLRAVSRYVTHAEVLVEADRLTREGDWKRAFVRNMGPDAYRAVRRWLNYNANPEAIGEDRLPLQRGLEAARSMASVKALGLNFLSGLKQRLGYAVAAGAMADASRTKASGWRYLYEGMREIGLGGNLGMENEKIQLVYSLSDYMAARSKGFDRDLRDSLNRLDGREKVFRVAGKEITLAEVRNSMFFWLRMNDNAVACASWLGAYKQAMNGDAGFSVDGLDPEKAKAKAIEYADGIAATQASGFSADLTATQRHALGRYFTMFISGAVQVGSRFWQMGLAWKRGQISTDDLLRRIIREGAGPGLAWTALSAAVVEAFGDDDDRLPWWEWLLSPVENMVSWVPLLREIPSMYKYGDRNAGKLPAISATLQAVNSVAVKAPEKISEGKVAAAMWDFWKGVEFVVGVPVSNVVRQAGNALDLVSDEEPKE